MKPFLCALSLILLASLPPVNACEDHDWTVLFDGSSTEHWRGFKRDSFPEGGWQVKEGVLTSIGSGERIDLITKKRYTNFELELEWRVEPRGNSGIFYRVTEEADTIWHLAPEYQLIDDGRVSNPLQSTGSLYDILPPNDQKKLRPVGEFNTSRIVIRGNQVEHWVNGENILSFSFDDPAVQEKIAQSKFARHDNFGQVAEGHVALQHHGDTVGFRNVRIRELPSPAAD
jgi:hypothetical protein